MIAGRECFSTWSTARAAARRKKLFFVTAVRSDLARQNAAATFHRAQHRRTRAVAKQHARLPIVVIDVLRQDLGADDDCVARLSCLDHRTGKRDAVQESGTRSDHVHCRGVVRAEFGLDDATG